MDPIDFFNSVAYLSPVCPQCRITLDYGLTTRYSDKFKTHICTQCGTVLN